MNRILFLSGITLFGFAALGFSTNARAQTALPVDVDITIEAGGIAILNYYDTIDVTIDPADLAALQAVDTCPPSSGVASCSKTLPSPGDANLGPGAGGGDLNADGGLTLTIPATSLRSVRLDLDNVWAVRAIGGLANSTTVTVLPSTGAAATLTNATTSSTIVIMDAEGYSMTGGLPDTDTTFPDPGLIAPQYGGVQLTLDVSNALTPGVYSTLVGSDVDPNYTIEITGT
jgi:hypothetical protein